MGGVAEGGVGIANRTSRRAEVEKVQAALRQEYDFREKRKRELEFLEKGGDPLEFMKDGNAASVSVQSTSFTNQLPDQLTSEAKGSFALTASPDGDSVESSGRLGTNPREPNSADNLMLFDAENDVSKGGMISSHPITSDIAPSKKLSQMDGNQISRGLGGSAAFNIPGKAYKRRNRSRPIRDGTRSSSTDVNPTFGSHSSSLPSHHGSREVKGFISDAEIQNKQTNCNSKPISPIVGSLLKNGSTYSRQELVLARGKSVESNKDQIQGVPPDTVSDAVTFEIAPSDQHNQHSPPDPTKTLTKMDSDVPEVFQTKEKMDSAAVECVPSVTDVNVENLSNSCQMKGVRNRKGEGMKNDNHNSSGLRVVKNLDSESSCTHTSLSIDGNNDSEMCTEPRNAESNGNIKDQTLAPDGMPIGGEDGVVKEKTKIEGVDSSIPFNVENTSAYQFQDNEVVNQSGSALEDKVGDEFASKGMESCVPNSLELERKPFKMLTDNSGSQKENSCNVIHDNSISIVNSEPLDGGPVSIDAQVSSTSASILPRKVDEDSILKEAQIIKAKRKRIGELSVTTPPKQIHPRSHWDLVLEEMAWLANDFAQERVWKIAAATQISTRAAFTIRLRNQEKYPGFVAKRVANNLAKSVLEFWHSIEEAGAVLKQPSQRDGTLSVKDYALRFMDYNKSNIVQQAEVPLTPDQLSDMGVPDLTWEDNLTEENLFYTVPPGAMEAYKNSIESHTSLCERVGNSVQEEVETSTCDAAADLESQDNMHDEDEGETNTYDMSIAFEGSKSSRLGQKKRKHLTHAYRYDSSVDFYAMQYAENKAVAHQSAFGRKRPGGTHNMSIPTKRVRTASRRVISPFSGGTPGFVQTPTKTEVSSGDTNSYQDDRSSLHGGSLVPNNLEVESVRDFEKHLPFDSAEVSTKHKKKKKAKHLKSAYGPRWQVDSTFQNEQFQKDRIRKIYQFDSNGSGGLLGQPVMKKPKVMLQSQDNSFENIAPIGGSVPSPAASQMSNMSNPNKVIKMLGGRDRGRKPKVLKMPAGQLGSGSPWTLFEDQALVVLVHDMGPNWELVSDAFNSTVQFKCVFRKAIECKERHHFLMDRTSGDGADSAEDSGSSQPYPSTLPGIPKGSARQLFQRLQGPMEEDTIKSHFEKIIIIGKKLLTHKPQHDNQDPRELPPHNSHTIALSQVCPNNLNGGPVLTPLDLCDATVNGSDIIPVGYQGQPGGLAIPNQATGTPMPGNSSMLPGSPNVIPGNNFASSPGALNSTVRYGVPRSTALSADEQRLQQYSQMVPNRNMAQSHISSPGAIPGTDRGIRLLPGSNGVGLGCGVNRNIPMSRHGFQGIGPSSIANSGCMVSRGVSPTNMHSGVGSGQGSSMLRPRETLHAVRPSLGQESPRQIMAPDLQMQASPGNGQGVSHFGGLSSPVPNPNASPPVLSYPLHHQPSHPPQQPQVLSPHRPHIQGSVNHASTPQQQAHTLRLAKERQQHRFLQQQPQQLQQQQFASSSSVLPHVQSESQLPSQGQLQTSSSAVPLSPLTSVSMSSMPHHPQKHQIPTQVVARNAQSGGSGFTNQTNKQHQRQQQQFSLANRQHPQPRQQLQAQQQAKASKGVGRGNMMAQQNISADPNLVNQVSTSPGNHSLEKGEPAGHLMRNQALSTGSALNAVQSTKQHVSSPSSSNSLPQQKIFAGQAASPTAKNINQLTSHSGNSSQGHVSPAAPGLSAGHQSILAMTGPNQQQKLVNPNQSALRRAIQSDLQINSSPSNKPQARDSDTDRHPTSSSEMDTVTTSPHGNSSASPSSAHQWHVSDVQTLNSATNMSSLASIPPNSSEAAPQVSQGLGQRQSSTSLPPIKQDSIVQWQQQPSQLQLPNSPTPQSQQHTVKLPALLSQKQAQILQAGNGNLHGRNVDHRFE